MKESEIGNKKRTERRGNSYSNYIRLCKSVTVCDGKQARRLTLDAYLNVPVKDKLFFSTHTQTS